MPLDPPVPSPAALTLCLALFSACRGGEDPGRCLRDKAALGEALESDRQAAAVLREADDLAVQRRADQAAALVEARVIPACDRGLARMQSWQPSSRWGRARRSEATAFMQERKASSLRYAEALRSGDAERVVAQMVVQKSVEQQALTLRASLERAPGAGECAP